MACFLTANSVVAGNTVSRLSVQPGHVWRAAAENSFCPFHPCIIRSCSLRLAVRSLDVFTDYGCFGFFFGRRSGQTYPQVAARARIKED